MSVPFAFGWGDRIRIREGVEGAGRLGYVTGSEFTCGGQKWVPVIWDEEEDPDLFKVSCIEYAPKKTKKGPRLIASKSSRSAAASVCEAVSARVEYHRHYCGLLNNGYECTCGETPLRSALAEWEKTKGS